MNLKNKTTKMITLLSMGMLLLASIGPITATEPIKERAIIYVDDDADSSWYDATHVRTIQEGIDNASTGDTVFVYNGTYYEHIIINKTVTLQGEDNTNTIIDGEEYGDVITILANNTMITSLTVRNAGNPPLSHSGILVSSNNNTITKMIITQNDIYGINLVSCSENNVFNNTIKNNGEGIRIYYANNNLVSQNNIQNNYYGLRNWYSSQNTIMNNTLLSNGNYGIFHKACQQTTINQNQISDSLYGIRFYDGSNHVVSSNILINNSIGLYQDADSNNHSIYNNYFSNDDNIQGIGIDNKWNISQNMGTNIINGSYLGGNYWNDYTGFDMNGDGIGDTNIPHGPGDYLPLVKTNNPPVANFTFSPTHPSTLTFIQFNDTSSDPEGSSDIVNWSWDFGDGNNSYVQNPTHSYSDNENFTVTLAIRDSQGAENTTQQTITVLNIPPVASFTYSPANPITNDVVLFNSTSFDYDGSIVNWSWDFNDGTYGYGENITHSFENGTYNVVLWITDDEGSLNVTNKTITIVNILPTVDFSYNPINPTTEDIISFYDLSSDREGRSIINRTWDFGDGSFSYVQNPTHSYDDNGTYPVTLTITDNDGASNATTKNITVTNVAPVANFSFSPLNPTTSDTVQFNDTSTDSDGMIVNWSWDFGDGNISYLQNATNQYADNGVYNVSLTIVDDDGFTNQINRLLSIDNTPPVANFSYSPVTPSTADLISFTDLSTDSDGVIVNWSWDFGDGSFSYNQHPTHSYAHSETYNVTLTVTDEDMGMHMTEQAIFITNIGPTADFSFSPLTPTTAQTVTFTDTSTDSDGMIVNWSWDFGDGSFSYDQHPTHQYADNGSYNVSLQILDDNGANDSTWAIINVSNALPVPNFTWTPSDPTELDLIQFYDLSSDRNQRAGVTSWNWDFGDGNFSSVQNPTHQYSDDGLYNVTLYVSDDDGAINSITKIVTVYTIAPVANFTFTPMLPSTEDIVLFTDTSIDLDGIIVNWSWDFGDGNISYLQNATHQYADNGNYTVKLTVVDDDGEVDLIQQQINISNVEPSINISYSPLNPTTQDLIQFTDYSIDYDGTIVSWYWDFDDGYQTAMQHPTHQYADNGVYNVSLTITDDDGAVNTTVLPITVLNAIPMASFSYNPLHPTVVDLISFTDLSTDSDGSIVNWSWDFGDGNNSYIQDPMHSYALSGNYSVSLTVSDDDGDTNTTTQIISVDEQPACFNEVWVDDDFNSSLWWWQITHFDTIQDAIDAVCANGTVYIADGVYDEQLLIDKPVTLIGNGSASTILTNTSTLSNSFMTSNTNYPIVYIYNTSDVTLQNLTIDGAGNGDSNYRYIGIGFYNAGGSLKNLVVKAIQDTPFSGAQHGVAIYAYVIDGINRTVSIDQCVIDEYQKNGMSLNGNNLEVSVTNNVVTGAGQTNVTAQNGIQIGSGATGLVDNNTVYGNWYTGPYWGASGGLIYDSDDLIITNNVFDTNQMAVYYYGSNGTITDNEFVNNEWSIVLWGDAYIFDNSFTNNSYAKTYMAEIATDHHCFTYIQDAIDAAPIGDTVLVYDGTYDENLSLNKQVTVTGVNSPMNTAIVTGIIDITGDDATLSNLFISPGNVTGSEAAVLIAASNITVSGNIIDGLHGDGTGSVKGIHLYSTTNDQSISISDNGITNVTNNGNTTVYGGSSGIMIQGVVDQISVINNTIEHVWSQGWAYGVEVTPTGSHPTMPPTNVIIEENTINNISATVYGNYSSCFSCDAYANAYPANASEITLSSNNFLNTSYGVINKDPVNILDATCNYWEDYTGPYHAVSNADGQGCIVTDNVTFTPWLDNPCPIGDCIGGLCTDPIYVDDDASSGWYDWDHVEAIETAMDRICTGGTIYVEPGLYEENFTIDKHVKIIGSGSANDGTIISQDQISAGDSHIGIINIFATGVSQSDPILIQDVQLRPDHLAGISIGRFTENTGTDVFYLKLDNVNIIGTNTNPNTEQERGLYVDLNSSLQYLEVYNSCFDNLTYGWYFHKEVSNDESTVQYVLVENTSFNHNNLKGIYAEKLSDAAFVNCEIKDNGFSSDGIPSYFLDWMSGVDINLKAGTYKNIDFETCLIQNNGLGGAKEGVGLTVKERGTGLNPSSSYAAYPANVNDISIIQCTIAGNERGMRFGEPGKGNIGPTNVTVNQNNIVDNQKNYSGSDGSAYGGLLNVMQSQIDASCNWWGNETGPHNQTSNPYGTGENITGNCSVIPWLTDMYPFGDCNGYPNAPPQVNFTFSPSLPTTADMIQFTDISTDDGTIVNWSWDFGDGNTSIVQHPTHHYLDEGIYNVTLTVRDDKNESNSTWNLVTVDNAIPNPDFEWMPLNPTTQDVVQFTDISTDRNSVLDWFWEFGDGYSSDLQNPTHQYIEDGTYNVTLTVTDDDGAVNATTKILVVSNVAPVSDFTYSPIDPMIDENISFNDSSSDVDGMIVNWTWDFDDGNISYQQNPTHIYMMPGNYSVCLVVTDNDGDNDTYCTSVLVSSGTSIIDVNQSVFDRGFPVRHAVDGDWAGAQNFTPSVTTLTKAELYLRAFGMPSFNLTVELRENGPEGTLLDTVTVPTEDVPTMWSWFEIDFMDISIDSSTDYFIVIPPAPSGITDSFGYEWGYAFGDQYPDGSFWFTRDGGTLWRDLPTMYEYTFKTYGVD